MTRHDITITIPRAGTRPWVAAQIEVRAADGGWQAVQAVAIRAQGRERRITVPCRVPDDAEEYRVVWVPEGGSAAGLRITDPATFKD